MSLSLAADPFIVAHRGASQNAPENTLPSFELAWKQGADAIEGDFYLTSDGHIICIHDKTTKRYTGLDWAVKDETLEKLRSLDVGAWKDPKFTGTRMPTIQEIFATVPAGKKFYIEVKCGPEIVPSLVKAIGASGLKDDQIVIISFDKEVIRDMKVTAPQYKACWLVGFKEDDAGKRTPTLGSVLKTLKEIRADGLSSNSTLVTQNLVKKVRDSGFEYHVWTVDDPDLAANLLSWGTMSITTNVPGYLREKLQN